MTATTDHTPTPRDPEADVVRFRDEVVVEAEPARPGLVDTIRSFTGYDELAIKRAFGASIDQLEETMLARAAAFVLRRRAGDVDDQAMVAVMSASIAGVRALFSDTEQDDDSDDSAGSAASTPEG